MNDSWHYMNYEGKSFIEDILKLLKDDALLFLYLDDGYDILIAPEDEVSVGYKILTINTGEKYYAVNTDKIIYFEFIPSSKTLNTDSDK
jgi:hypothetical protein